MIGRERRALLALVVAVALVAIVALAAGVLAALPVLLAFGPLLAGRYLGATQLDRLLERRLRGAARRPPAGAPRPRRLDLDRPRGGALIASALAKRPPPVAPVAA